MLAKVEMANNCFCKCEKKIQLAMEKSLPFEQ
jgi:hypothetical protein